MNTSPVSCTVQDIKFLCLLWEHGGLWLFHVNMAFNIYYFKILMYKKKKKRVNSKGLSVLFVSVQGSIQAALD